MHHVEMEIKRLLEAEGAEYIFPNKQDDSLCIVLGSNSMSRKSVLTHYGYEYGIFSPQINEKRFRSDDTNLLPMLVADAKMGETLKVFIQNIFYNDSMFKTSFNGRKNISLNNKTMYPQIDFTDERATQAIKEYLKVSVYSSYTDTVAEYACEFQDQTIAWIKLADALAALANFSDQTNSIYSNNKGELIDKISPLIVTCDTIVVSHKGGEKVREKPKNSAEIKEFYESYSNDTTDFVSGTVVLNFKTGKLAKTSTTSRVEWKSIPDNVIARLANSPQNSDIFHCSGAIMVENMEIRSHMASICPNITNIIGLPMNALNYLFKVVTSNEFKDGACTFENLDISTSPLLMQLIQ